MEALGGLRISDIGEFEEVTEMNQPANFSCETVEPVRDATSVTSKGFRTHLVELGADTPPRREVHSRFFYALQPGCTLRRDGTRISVVTPAKKGAGEAPTVIASVPVLRLQGVLVYGNIQVTTQLVRLLLEEGVWVSFLTGNGVYKGRLQPPTERGGRLRARQRERLGDESFRLDAARHAISGKVAGARIVAAAYSTNYPAASLGEARSVLERQQREVESAASLAQLRGIEGTAARAWFELFSRANRSAFGFPGRTGRGASDPVNILLNFGYTLLCREIEGLLESAGLDPTLGFFHEPIADRPSLACDLMEEFRHPVVDRLVLRLINNRMITEKHFEDRGDRGGLRLGSEGVRRFSTEYERLMTATGQMLPADEADEASSGGWRHVFLQQLGRLLDAFRGADYRNWMEPAA